MRASSFQTDVGLFLLSPRPPRPWEASGDAALLSQKTPPAGRPHLRGGGWGSRVLVILLKELSTLTRLHRRLAVTLGTGDRSQGGVEAREAAGSGFNLGLAKRP